MPERAVLPFRDVFDWMFRDPWLNAPERRAGQVARTISLPAAIDPDGVTCTFERGELRVVLPKSAESRARQIPIGGAQAAKQVGSGA